MTHSIPISKPYFGPEENAAVVEPLQTGWVVQGPKVAEFEAAFGTFTGSAFSAACSSCTTALHLAVAALGLQPADEVIVPAFTWVATPNVAEYQCATPVFADIDLATFNINPAAIEPLVTEKTVGILPVHLFGLCAEMDPILDVARENNLWVVEDAACGLGAMYKGRHAGTLGDAGCFSFHPRKSITTGEGGMITVQDEELDELIRSLRDHGASKSDLARHSDKGGFLLPEYKRLGFNYRMTDIQGALGCVQMTRAEWILSERARLAARYDDALSHLDWLRTPQVPKTHVHGYQSYVCLFAPEEPSLENVEGLNERRNAIMARLEERGIATRQGTHAPITQEFYVRKYGLTPRTFPNAAIAEKLSISLPMFAGLTDDDQDRVITQLLCAFEECM